MNDSVTRLNFAFPQTKISFMDQDGVLVGGINFVDGEMRFTGNADAAARIFFDYVVKNICDDYIREQLKIERRRHELD